MRAYKCPYEYCKNDNKVLKDVAIKYKNRYYCPECYAEKIKKEEFVQFYLDNFPLVFKKRLHKFVKYMIYDNDFTVDYLMFVGKKILGCNMKVQSLEGFYYIAKQREYFEAYKQGVGFKFKEVM